MFLIICIAKSSRVCRCLEPRTRVLLNRTHWTCVPIQPSPLFVHKVLEAFYSRRFPVRLESPWSSRLPSWRSSFLHLWRRRHLYINGFLLRSREYVYTIQALHVDSRRNAFNAMFVVRDQQLSEACVLITRCPLFFSANLYIQICLHIRKF